MFSALKSPPGRSRIPSTLNPPVLTCSPNSFQGWGLQEGDSVGILTVVGCASVGAAAWHVPVRGRSLRERLNPAPRPGTIVGIRLHPTQEQLLHPAELDAILREAPVEVESLVVTRIAPPLQGEYVHSYRTIADRLGVTHHGWTHVIVSGVERSERLHEFLSHRFGCLGIRSRPLSEEELGAEGTVMGALRRRGSNPHLRRPAGWSGPAEGVHIEPVPMQVIGICSSGSAVCLPLVTAPKVMLSGHPGDAERILIPALATGVRTGLSTLRPGRFATLQQRGAQIVTPGSHHEFDLILEDLGQRRSRNASPHGTSGIQLVDPAHLAPDPPVNTGFLAITTGTHTWTITRDSGESTVFRPV